MPGSPIEEWLNEVLQSKEIKHIAISHNNLPVLFARFKKIFVYKTAGGGVVLNPEDMILVILRFGIWDLPKGKQEKGEEIRETALREVAEECGIDGHVITKELPDTYHIYFLNNNPVLKHTFWFEMKYAGDEILHPQIEESITKVKWLKKDNLPEIKTNTYASLWDIFKIYLPA